MGVQVSSARFQIYNTTRIYYYYLHCHHSAELRQTCMTLEQGGDELRNMSTLINNRQQKRIIKRRQLVIEESESRTSHDIQQLTKFQLQDLQVNALIKAFGANHHIRIDLFVKLSFPPRLEF